MIVFILKFYRFIVRVWLIVCCAKLLASFINPIVATETKETVMYLILWVFFNWFLSVLIRSVEKSDG